MRPSKSMSLNHTDWKNILRGGVIFVAPVILIYFAQVTGALSVEGHAFSVRDFIPSTFTQGSMVLFVLNRLTDILRKFVS